MKQKIILMHNIPDDDVQPIYQDLLHYLDQHWAACSECKHYFKRSDYHIKTCQKCKRAKREQQAQNE